MQHYILKVALEALQTKKVIDEDGRESEVKKIGMEPVGEFFYRTPILVTFPDGKEILLLEHSFDKYCAEFGDWAEFTLGKLLEHARREDIISGIIPGGGRGRGAVRRAEEDGCPEGVSFNV